MVGRILASGAVRFHAFDPAVQTTAEADHRIGPDIDRAPEPEVLDACVPGAEGIAFEPRICKLGIVERFADGNDRACFCGDIDNLLNATGLILAIFDILRREIGLK